jgi:hypothetical protein
MAGGYSIARFADILQARGNRSRSFIAQGGEKLKIGREIALANVMAPAGVVSAAG